MNFSWISSIWDLGITQLQAYDSYLHLCYVQSINTLKKEEQEVEE